MRSALCVAILAVCLVVLQCTAADKVTDGQNDGQRSEDPGTTAVTTTTTKEPQAAPEPQQATLPEVPEVQLDSAGPEVLNVPSDGEVPAAHSPPEALDVSPPVKKTPTTTIDLPTHQTPLQPSSTDHQDRQDQQPLQQQQANTSQGPGVKTKDDPTVIQPKVDNPPNRDGTQPEPDVKTPDVHAALKPEPAPPSSGQSKQQTQQPPRSQTPQTQQSNTNSSGAKSQHEIGNASQSGPLAPKRTTTAAATEKRNEDAKESTTTTTVAPTQRTSIVPTTILQKETKRPQSVDNKDSNSGTSLLFAFAILVTLAVIPVAPAF